MLKQIMVAGSGNLGSQIAFQSAFKGFQVTLYDINEEVLDQGRERVANLQKRYLEEIADVQKAFLDQAAYTRYTTNLLPNITEAFDQNVATAQKQIEETLDRLHFSSDLKAAAADADLMIEAIPEVMSIKVSFYEGLAQVAPAKTIFATNTSTLLPSKFAAATGRPDKFVALHFANEIWRNNVAEIMGHEGTDPAVFQQVTEFAKQIGMIPTILHKEVSGYVLNSLLGPFLTASLNLIASGAADRDTIDRTWMLSTGSPRGPLGFLDIFGLQTAYNATKNLAEMTHDDSFKAAAAFLKENYVDKNKLGVATNEGFYSYPNPRYEDPDFLQGEA